MPEVNLDAVRIAKPADVRPAAERLREMVRDMTGFRVAICHNIASKQTMLDAEGNVLATDVFGWTLDENDRWWRTPRLALDSPLPTACRYESEPFWCNAQGIRTKMPNPMLAAIDLTNFERRGLTPAAIVVPVHLPFGQIGAASYVPLDRARIDVSAEFEAYGDVLGLLTRTFIAGYVRVMCDPERLPVGAILSKREVECLRWAAVGKTDFEISMIMSRSRATVRFHIHNASTKLDAVNRSQTLFKAAQLGYIGLNSQAGAAAQRFGEQPGGRFARFLGRMTETLSRPIAPDLFTDEPAPRLIGGRHRESGRIVFPCPGGAEGALYDAVPLARSGTLWSWTVQRFRPKTPPYAGPAAFEPFALGYVELAGETIVEARLTDVAFDELRVGMPLALTFVPFSEDGSVVTYAFRPAGEVRA